jgi:hypothetical protein
MSIDVEETGPSPMRNIELGSAVRIRAPWKRVIGMKDGFVVNLRMERIRISESQARKRRVVVVPSQLLELSD